MYLSTRGRYAIMAMIDLVELAREAERPVTLAQIAERQRISLSYLEQLFGKLRKAGVVESVRGPGGGYKVAPPEQISLASIIAAVDEDVDVTRCGGSKNCMGGKPCNAHSLWEALETHINGFMQRVTLAMVLEGRFPVESLGLHFPKVDKVTIEGMVA